MLTHRQIRRINEQDLRRNLPREPLPSKRTISPDLRFYRDKTTREVLILQGQVNKTEYEPI